MVTWTEVIANSLSFAVKTASPFSLYSPLNPIYLPFQFAKAVTSAPSLWDAGSQLGANLGSQLDYAGTPSSTAPPEAVDKQSTRGAALLFLVIIAVLYWMEQRK